MIHFKQVHLSWIIEAEWTNYVRLVTNSRHQCLLHLVVSCEGCEPHGIWEALSRFIGLFICEVFLCQDPIENTSTVCNTQIWTWPQNSVSFPKNTMFFSQRHFEIMELANWKRSRPSQAGFHSNTVLKGWIVHRGAIEVLGVLTRTRMTNVMYLVKLFGVGLQGKTRHTSSGSELTNEAEEVRYYC